MLDDESLERSAIVANCRMNRERNLRGSNGYDQELGFDPTTFLKDKSSTDGTAAWLDLCCGTGRALIQAAEIFWAERHPIDIVGVDLVGMFHPTPPDLGKLRLIEASLSTWRPDHAFDLITCVHGLHYVGDKPRLITRAASWLTQDGLFIANLDLNNLKVKDQRLPSRQLSRRFRLAELLYEARHHRILCRGRRSVKLPYCYLGADDTAGPNYTRQPAVDSHYEMVQ